MPYGRPVSRRRRRRFQPTQSSDSSAMLTAHRLALKADADSLAPPPTPTSPPHYHQSAPQASPSILCAGYRVSVWPLRERLALASALMDADNQQLTWPTISRRLAKFAPPSWSKFSRPSTWCSARACAKQYSLLLDSAEMSRKQQVDAERSTEEGRVVFQAPGDVAAATGTVGLSLAELIVKRLTIERVEELRNHIMTAQQTYRLIKEKIEELECGKLGEHVATIWSLIQERENHHLDSTSSEKIAQPEVKEFLQGIYEWIDPFDVPQSVWTVPGGNGVGLRNIPSVSKVAGSKTCGRSSLARRQDFSVQEQSNTSIAEEVDGADGEKEEGVESTPSTSVMSDSELESDNVAETDDQEMNATKSFIDDSFSMPFLTASHVKDPKEDIKVEDTSELELLPAVEGLNASLPPQLEEEVTEDYDDSYQPHSLRLRLSRQDDGNLSVISGTEDTAVSPPLRLRLSLSPVSKPSKSLKQWSKGILQQAFANMNFENTPASPKRLRSANANEEAMYEAARSILAMAVKQSYAMSDVEESTRRKMFVHSVLSQLTQIVYCSPRKDTTLSAQSARQIYSRLAPLLHLPSVSRQPHTTDLVFQNSDIETEISLSADEPL